MGPQGVWAVGKKCRSASPHTTRSVPVGFSFRWTVSSSPSGEKIRLVLYRVALTPSRSETPMLT